MSLAMVMASFCRSAEEVMSSCWPPQTPSADGGAVVTVARSALVVQADMFYATENSAKRRTPSM